MARTHLLAWASIVLSVVYLTVLGGGAFTGLYFVELRIASVAILVTALGVWVIVALRRPFWHPRTVMTPAIVAVPAAIAVSIVASEHPRLGLDYLAYAVLLAAAYLLLQRLFAHPFFAPRLGALAVLLGFSLCVIYIGVVVYRWVELWTSLGRFVIPPLRPGYEGLTYGNPSAIAVAVILLWLASAARLGFGTARRGFTLIVLGVLTTVVVVLTGSRGAWVALAMASAVLVPAWLGMRPHREALVAMSRSTAVRIGAGLTLLVGVAATALFLPALLSRLAEPAGESRSSFFNAAWRIFVDDPITGAGAGMYVVERASHTEAGELDFYVAHAHHIYVQTLAELGLIGALAGVVLLANVGILILRGIRSAEPLERRLGWAIFAGTLYLGAHQLFDFYVNMAALGFLFAIPVAWLDALQTSNRAEAAPVAPGLQAPGRGRSPIPFMATVAILVATVLSSAWLAQTEAAALIAREATAAANTGDWPRALDRARSAVRAEPDMPPSLFTLGLAASNQGSLEEARDAFRQAAELDDYPTAWVNLAKVELDLGNDDAARAALERALRLGRQEPQVTAAAALLYVELGDQDAAVESLRLALATAPGIAGDPFWRSTPALQIAWSSAIAEVLNDLPGYLAYQVALEAELPDRAREIVLALPTGSQVGLLPVVDAWIGDVQAFRTLHANAVANPLNANLVALCRRVAHHGRENLNLDPGTWQCDGAGTTAAPIFVKIGAERTSRVDLPGANSGFHYQAAYRRFVPFDELVPGLPRLTPVPV